MNRFFIIGLILLVFMSSCGNSPNSALSNVSTPPLQTLKLPEPRLTGDMSLEETLATRRSIREYSPEPLSLAEVSQLLWAAQGITADWGGRTAPSAGGLFPLEIYLVSGRVVGLSPGVYQYSPTRHELLLLKDGDLRAELSRAALNQAWVRESALDFVISTLNERITPKYGDRGIRYAQMEAGHAAQNLCLQVTSLGLGAVTVGAFDDNEVKKVLGLHETEIPLYVIPVGKIL